MVNKLFYFGFIFAASISILNIDCVAQSDFEILDSRVEAFNQRDIEKYLNHMHDSVKVITFPNEVTNNNKAEVRASYGSAFKATSLGGKMRIVNRRKFGDCYIQEEWLEGFNSEPVMNYVMYRFKGDKIVEIVYLPGNWKPGR